MSYIDGFVLAVPTADKQKYRQHAKATGQVFKECGAIKVVECWGDDVPDGELTSFPMAVKCKDDETVCFSWIVWPSKESRDAGMQQAEQHPLFQIEDNPMPFDGKRMIFGGFEVMLEI